MQDIKQLTKTWFLPLAAVLVITAYIASVYYINVKVISTDLAGDKGIIFTNHVNYKNTQNEEAGQYNKLNTLPGNREKTLKFLFFGDIMLDRHVGEKIEKYGLDYIFAKLAGEENRFFQGIDLLGGNLEGAVTTDGRHYPPAIVHDFAFAPSLIKQLKKYNFNLFNLANNHFADQGEHGIIETRENLKELSLYYMGCQDGRSGECSSTVIEIADKKIGLAGFSMVYNPLNESEIRKVISDLAGATDFVIANIHWGIEYEHQFNAIQQRAAHLLIDAGTDMIIGHHPHVIQGLEVYRGKPIFYSLGNFIFDQYFSLDTQEGLAVGVSVNNERMELFLFPLKSRLSQVELMGKEEKDKLFKKIIQWSEVNNQIATQIENGKIIFRQ